PRPATRTTTARACRPSWRSASLYTAGNEPGARHVPAANAIRPIFAAAASGHRPMNNPMKVAVIGAGTMGSGIAQVAAQAGHDVYLYDTRPEAVQRALATLQRTLQRLVEKGRLTADAAATVHARIRPATDLGTLADSGLVIEAIVEDLDIKRRLFADLEKVLGADAVLATNT